MPPIVAVIAAVATVAVGIATINAIKKAGVQQTKATEVTGQIGEVQKEQVAVQREIIGLEQRSQEVAVRRERRGAIREAQIRRARAISQATAAGAGGGSGLAGGLGSLGSQLGGALGFSTTQGAISGEISQRREKLSGLESQVIDLGVQRQRYLDRASYYGGRAEMFGGAMSLFGGQLGGFGTLTSLFRPRTPNLTSGIGG